MNAHKFLIFVIAMLLASMVLSACAPNADVVRQIVQEEVQTIEDVQAHQGQQISDLQTTLPDTVRFEVDESLDAKAPGIAQTAADQVLAAMPTQQLVTVPSAEEIAALVVVPEVDEEAIAAAAAAEVLANLPQQSVVVVPPISAPVTNTVTGQAITVTQVYTESLPNVCLLTNTTQEDIDGQLITDPATGLIYENAALGVAGCASGFEGRWYEGFAPASDHHVSAFFSSVENASVFEGSQWAIPVGTEVREILYGLAVGKCQNWQAAKVSVLPLVFDYVDMKTMQIVHQQSTCSEVAAGNPLPVEIGLIPGHLVWGVPHFGVTGGGWGMNVSTTVITTTGTISPTATVTVTSTSPIVFSGSILQGPVPAPAVGESKFDLENKGLNCAVNGGPAFGNNDAGVAAVLAAGYDPQCVYTLDGINSASGIAGISAVGLVRGADLQAVFDAGLFDASIWPIPSGWKPLETAKRFPRDAVCGGKAQTPVLLFEDGAWYQVDVVTCP